MKKIIKHFWVFLFLACYVLVKSMTAEENIFRNESFSEKSAALLRKIAYVNRIPTTFEISVIRERKIPDTENWKPTWRTEIIKDNIKRKCLVRIICPNEENPMQQLDSTIFHDKERITYIRRISKIDAHLRPNIDFVEKGSVRIMKNSFPDSPLFVEWDFSSVCRDGTYFVENLDVIKEENLKEIIYSNTPCLEITIDRGKNRAQFIFEKETGKLLKRVLSTTDDKDYKAFEYLNFVYKDSFFIPEIVKMTYFNSEENKHYYSRARLEIQRCHFNKNISQGIFIPRLPDGAEVIDEIEKREYKANNLTERERDNAIASQLDKIFEEENKREAATNQK